MKINIFPEIEAFRTPTDTLGDRSSARRNIVRRCFEAYEKKDRGMIEPHLSEDFTFGSPLDDDIDREHYFARCWPNSEHLVSFTFERLIADGDEVVATYRAKSKDGAEFRNTEIFTFRGDKITHVQVYFGSETGNEASSEEIASIINAWAEGLRRKDVEAVARHFVDEPVGFYLAPPLVADEDLRKNLTDWFATFEGPLGYEVRDLKVHASGDVGWAHALNHLTGRKKEGEATDLWFRLTMGFEKIGGEWKIAHAHESVPFLMDGSEKAALDLKP